MGTQTIFLIILAVIVALGMVVFQYYYKSKKRGNLGILLSGLRFLALLGLFLLLVNPEFSKKIISLEKPNLVLLVDNSSSIKPYGTGINEILKSIKENKGITDRFNVLEYSFGTSLSRSDSPSFSEKNTNITDAIATLNHVYVHTTSAIVLLSDGNQTMGEDYGFYGKNQKFPIYPVVIGDTVRYEDLRVDRVNTNRYAFLKNKFPLETYISYEGSGSSESVLSISVDGENKYRQKINFSKSNHTKVINTLLEANSVGAKSIQVTVSPFKNEKNRSNNHKVVAIEVIDEKTDIAIISNMPHPDVGALTRAIESNEQRSVVPYKPTVSMEKLEKVDLFVLYQPDASFRPIYDYLNKSKTSFFTITGVHTDWGFLNSIQSGYRVEDNYPIQEIFPVRNPTFSKFDISEFSWEGYPPLESNAGPIGVSGEKDILLSMRIKGKDMGSPLLCILDGENSKEAVLFGENLWKWRMQSYRDHQNFKDFDGFIGKLILYLSENKSKERLNVDYKAVYESSNGAKISATYFDETFVFDENVNISTKLMSKENDMSKEIPMLLKGNYYEADISDLPPGQYSFTVTVEEENRSKSGSFSILDFDVEQQFQSSDYKKLGALAYESSGELYYPSNIGSFVKNVTNDDRFRPIERSQENIVSLIDFRVILLIIVASLILEWFIRKYNGLI